MNKKAKYGMLPALILMLALTACSSGNPGAAGGSGSGGTAAGGAETGNPPPAANEPVEISVMATFFNASPAAADTPFELHLEQLINAKLNVQWTSPNNYDDKLNITLASGDIPDLVFVNDPFASVFRTTAAQGAFWDITPYVQDYPNFVNIINEVAWEGTKMGDGKNYGIPRPRAVDGDTWLNIRKDWLDAVGLPEPTTADELYEVMKAFTHGDPDGDGQDNTFGYAGQVNPSDMGSLAQIENIFSGANGPWKLQEDGTLAYVPLLPEARQALEYITNMYKDKLLPPDVASLKITEVRNLFKAGKAGVVSEKPDGLRTYFAEIRKIDPNGDILPLTNVNNYNPVGVGFAGLYAIPKKVPEAKMKQILQVMNDGMNPEPISAIKYGLEGVHHTVQNGEKVIDAEAKTRDSIADYSQIFIAPDRIGDIIIDFPKEVWGEWVDQLVTIVRNRHQTGTPNYAFGLYSETQLAIGAELEKDMQDLKTKIIIGQQPITAWDDFVAGLNANPDIAKMIEEINAAYRSRTGGAN